MITATENGTWSGEPYHPNSAAAIIFIALFGLGTLCHVGQMFWLRTWYFIPFIIGCVMETFGYYGRFWLSQQPTNFKAYVLYDLLVLPAPIFLAATIYMSFSRIITALNANDLSRVRPSIMSKLFIFGDVVCFIVQLAGVGMGVTTSLSIQKIGAKVVVVGLVFQILVFAMFIWAVIVFFRRASSHLESTAVRWRLWIVALLTASACIVLRNLVRGIEHAQGSGGFVSSHEVFLYLFDALPITCVVVLMAVFHPGLLRRSCNKHSTASFEEAGTFEASDGLMREKSQKGYRSRPCSYPRERE